MADPERKPATYTYDPDTNVAYIELAGPTPTGGVARTVPVTAMADFDADGNPLGLEILGLDPDRARGPARMIPSLTLSQQGIAPTLRPAPRSVVASEPRLFANEIQDILRELDLAHVVAKINATARPEPDSHNAMLFLSADATESAIDQLVDAFTQQGWLTSVALNNTKIYVYERPPDKRSAPSGEAMRRGEHGC